MRVLVACEFSGVVRDAFRRKGHDAWSCDILPANPSTWSEYHMQGDVLKVLDRDWDLLIAHPPCQFLTNAGVRHLHDRVESKNGKKTKIAGSERWVRLFEGAAFFNALKDADIPRICVENPIPHKYARALIGNYTQLIQPWQFGHGETKATCLWLKNLPKLEPTNIVEGRHGRIHRMAPGPERSKLRSITYKGIAEAMAEQWGNL